MAEYIERKKAIDLFYPVDSEHDGSDGCTIVCKSGNFSSAEIETMLSELPAADVEPVVRCHECIYSTNPGNDILFCDHFERDMMPDDFCSCGAKMDLKD